ncbi:hypothetical protein LRS13_04760 [Svornostia abyssi]|uniref:Uncharacterized protein n=1 Tax=Svornostia abyssi TaxID=2898438 RepID=A0ABY5PJV7_9ACTN|nr:hypothetical protein LRS13_04760 [Parviterribacteraceae bacterium J379]
MICRASLVMVVAGLWAGPAQAAVFGGAIPLSGGQPALAGLVAGAPGTAALVTSSGARVTVTAVRGGVEQGRRTMRTRELVHSTEDPEGRLLLLLRTGAVRRDGLASSAIVLVDATGGTRMVWRGRAARVARIGAGSSGRMAIAWMQSRSLVVKRIARSGREGARLTTPVLPPKVDPRRTEVRGLAVVPGPGRELDAVVSIAAEDDRLDRTAAYTWDAAGQVRRGAVRAGASSAAGRVRLVRAPDGRVGAMLTMSGVSPTDQECVSEDGHLPRGVWLAMRGPRGIFGRFVNVDRWGLNCIATDDLVLAPDGTIAAAWGFYEASPPFVRVAQFRAGEPFGLPTTVMTGSPVFSAAFSGTGTLNLLTGTFTGGETLQPAALWRDGQRDDLGFDVSSADLARDTAGRLVAAGQRGDGTWVIAFER